MKPSPKEIAEKKISARERRLLKKQITVLALIVGVFLAPIVLGLIFNINESRSKGTVFDQPINENILR